MGSGIALGTLAALPLSAQRRPTQRGQKAPKNIIYCVSDGMSMGVPALVEQYLQRVMGKKASTLAKLLTAETTTLGTMDTRSLSSLVTDSAAASSAWGSGSYVWNGMINMLPDKTPLRPILPILKEEAKMRTGLVTTATITHATPAGWAVSTEGRGSEATIAELYLAANVDVLMGGGKRFFNDELLAKFTAAGYGLAQTKEAMRNDRSAKCLGLFADSHIPYEMDRKASFRLQREVPSLAEMTQSAISRLAGTAEGFILQVEGARIDHAAHMNDAAAIIQDQLAFEEAVQIALDFALHDEETLVVVCTDHGNANPGLIGAGGGYYDSTAGLEKIAKMTESYEVLLPKLNADLSDSDTTDQIKAALGVTISPDELSLLKASRGKGGPLSTIEQYNTTPAALGLALTNHTHVCWSGRQHSSDWVMIAATGPGSEAFGGHIKNIDVFGKLLSFRDLKIKNPSMSWEKAHALKVSSIEQDIHWAV